ARAFTDIAGVLARARPGREEAKAFAALGERLDRIESRLDEQPAANARPIRSALARLESRLDLLASEDRGAGFEQAVKGLDRRIADIARRLDDEASHARAAKAPPPSVGAAGISDDGSPRGAAPRFDALQQSIDSIARRLDGLRQDSTERADIEIVATRQAEELRRDIQDMAKAIRELAPRASIAAIETTLRDLCARVESQRERGVADSALAPAERIVGELRAVMKDLDPSPFVRNLRVDIETIGHRLDRLQAQSLDASVVRDLARETHEIKRQLATLVARPMPLEKIETRLLDLARRIDGLNFSSGASAADLGEMIGAIRSIVSAETSKNFETFNNRLEQIARKLDDVAARADAAPLEEFVASLAKKIDSALDGKAQEAQAHMPAIEEIGRKIDRLETRFAEAPAAEPGADRQFADLATRIDELRLTLAQRIDGAADGGQFDPQALERQLAQLSYKIDRLDDPAANSWLGSLLSRPDQHSRLDEISERLESMQAALESRVEDGARIEARQSDLAALVEKLALRMNEAVDLEADGARGSVESRIDDLIERMDGARVAMTDAAEAAVRRATQEILREAAGVDVSALRATVESELFDIRKAQEESGQRARETLTAVHDTLERVVDRLTLFEEELNELRAAPARRESAPAGQSLETDERSLHRSSVQADFIAAARRAAQQAALEADLQQARRA
ncbi:peptidoglycan-binding protein, partial [Methylocystis sp. 9N]